MFRKKPKTAKDIRQAAIEEGRKIINRAKIATAEYQQHLELEKIKNLDKLIKADIKRQIRELAADIKKSKRTKPKVLLDFPDTASSIDKKEIQKKDLEKLRDNFVRTANKRNKDIKKKKITFKHTEAEGEDEITPITTYDQILAEHKKSDNKGFVATVADAEENSSGFRKDVDTKLKALSDVNDKLNKLYHGIEKASADQPIVESSQFKALKVTVEGDKEKAGLDKTLKVHRNTDSATSKFWNTINNVLKHFRKKANKEKNLEFGVKGTKYTSGLHGLFGKHERVIEKHQKQLTNLQKREQERLKKEEAKRNKPIIVKL